MADAQINAVVLEQREQREGLNREGREREIK